MEGARMTSECGQRASFRKVRAAGVWGGVALLLGEVAVDVLGLTATGWGWAPVMVGVVVAVALMARKGE